MRSQFVSVSFFEVLPRDLSLPPGNKAPATPLCRSVDSIDAGKEDLVSRLHANNPCQLRQRLRPSFFEEQEINTFCQSCHQKGSRV